MAERHHAPVGDQVAYPSGLHVEVGPLVDPERACHGRVQGDVVVFLGFLHPGDGRIVPVDRWTVVRVFRVRDGADQIPQVVGGAPVDGVPAGPAVKQRRCDGHADQVAHGDADRGPFRPVLPDDVRQTVRAHGHAHVVRVLQWGEDVGQVPQVRQILTRPLRRPIVLEVFGFRGSVAGKHEACLLQFDETVRFGQFLEHRVQRHRTAGFLPVGGKNPFLHVRGQYGSGLPFVRIPQVAGSLERGAHDLHAVAFDGLGTVLDVPVQSQYAQRAAGRERRVRPTVRAVLQPATPMRPDPCP